MRHLHLLIKPASGHCNLRCRYCFYYDLVEQRPAGQYGMMSEETLEAVLQKAIDYAEESLTVAYQGGEPTLRGLDFFKKAVALERQYNQKGLTIHHAIQINGVGMDDRWAQFFKQEDFLVGLSLDGSSQNHDLYRLDHDGKDSYSKVMQTVRLFQKHGVQFNILTVVHKFTAKNIRQIYRFFKAQQFDYLQFIPCLDPIAAAAGGEVYSLTPKAYGDFLCTLFDLWVEDLQKGNTVHIRQFENYIEMLLGYPPESCGMSGICSYQHVVEADGEVYPCDFYVLDDYRLGNLNTCTFDDLQQRRTEIQFIETSKQIDPACTGCTHFSLCRGGCRRYRGQLGEELQLNYHCEAYRRFFTHATPRLYALARQFQSTMTHQ